VCKVLRALYWLLLAASIWFPIHAYLNFEWPGWLVAYVYAAILGVFFGALSFLSIITTDLRKRLGEIP